MRMAVNMVYIAALLKLHTICHLVLRKETPILIRFDNLKVKYRTGPNIMVHN